MNRFSSRPVVIYDLPVPAEAPVLKPEQAILRFADGATIDIGALCYQRRAPTFNRGRRRATEGRKVMLSSLCTKRVTHIRALITHISTEVQLGSKRNTTLLCIYNEFCRFMTWADETGHSNALDDADAARQAATAYAGYIRERVRTHEIMLNTGTAMQSMTFAVLSEFLNIENLTQGINLLRKDKNNTTPTSPPNEEDQGRTLALCEALFDGLTSLVLEGNSYPFGIAMPPYLGYPENIMWVFPTHVWCLPPAQIARKAEDFSACGYDYRAGRLATRNEVKETKNYRNEFYRKKLTKNLVTKVLKNAKYVMDTANGNPIHWHRRYMAIMALNVFIPLFLSRAAINWSQAVALTWSGKCSDAITTVRQRLRTIKQKAGGKSVSYELPLMFMPVFKRYLQLRDFLLQGHPDFDRLFFTMGNRAAHQPTRIKTSLGVTLQVLTRIDPLVAPVLSRAWRAGKGNFVSEKTDIATTAQVLQNKQRTSKQSYATGTETSHLAEMSTFLDQMIVGEETARHDNISAVGDCTSYGNPSEILGVVAVVPPSCNTPEVGCLFCDKCKVHADEIDVRKLLSCRYCLTRTSHLAGFHAMSAPLINRIQLILDEVHKRDALLVSKITQEVTEGELDPYWAAKYDMLLRLRLVSDES
jgi:hypothetical protein